MHPLNITKVAVGLSDLDQLRDRMAERAGDGGEAWFETRYRPTRHPELIGGSIYWILKHRLVARQRILGFVEAEGGRWRVRLEGAVLPVRARARRAHQGWRYLAGKDAPADLDGEADDLALLPAKLAGALAALALI